MSDITRIDSERVRVDNVTINIDGNAVRGAVLVNRNQDAEFFKYDSSRGTIDSFATLRSDASNNYNWRFVEQRSAENLLTEINRNNPDAFPDGQSELQQKFYNDPNVVRELNTLRRTGFSDPNGFNSPQLAQTLPGGRNAAPPDTTGGGGGGGGDDTSLNVTQENFRKFGINAVGVRPKYGNLRYPIDLNIETPIKQDVIYFKMYESFVGNREFTLPRFGPRTDKALEGSVTIAIQPRISDSNTVTWNDSNAGLIELGAANASLKIAQSGFTGAKETISELKNLVSGPEQNNIETAVKITLASAAASTQNLLSRLSGGILNPNLELLFENPDLRIFTYNFQLSPREPEEAREIRRIIRFFKQGMAVQRTAAELFLKAPNVFDIRYLRSENQGAEHPYLNKIKRCALMNCSVDYTPTGSYMTFSGDENSMVSYNLSLTFKELEPIYADEYGRSPSERGDNDTDTQIGF